MSLFRKIFDNLTQQEFHWAGAFFRVAFLWAGAFFLLLVTFYAAYRMKALLSSIPGVIQFACVFLVLLAVLLIVTMLRERSRALAAHHRFLALLEDLKPATDAERICGLSANKIGLLRRKAASVPGKPREWWRNVDQSLELYTSPSGQEGWFLTKPLAECLPEEDVLGAFYHASFHQSVPSILTALGLLATFVAILMALAGVTYNINDPVRPVSGIDQLINGLSGKFVSSIVALILSVIFTFFEKKVCDRPLTQSYDLLVRRCADLFPFLSPTRILLDIQRIALQQAQMKQAQPATPQD